MVGIDSFWDIFSDFNTIELSHRSELCKRTTKPKQSCKMVQIDSEENSPTISDNYNNDFQSPCRSLYQGKTLVTDQSVAAPPTVPRKCTFHLKNLHSRNIFSDWAYEVPIPLQNLIQIGSTSLWIVKMAKHPCDELTKLSRTKWKIPLEIRVYIENSCTN